MIPSGMKRTEKMKRLPSQMGQSFAGSVNRTGSPYRPVNSGTIHLRNSENIVLLSFK